MTGLKQNFQNASRHAEQIAGAPVGGAQPQRRHGDMDQHVARQVRVHFLRPAIATVSAQQGGSALAQAKMRQSPIFRLQFTPLTDLA